jgi:hypothetical protein
MQRVPSQIGKATSMGMPLYFPEQENNPSAFRITTMLWLRAVSLGLSVAAVRQIIPALGWSEPVECVADGFP